MRYNEETLTNSKNTAIIKTFYSSVPKGKRDYNGHFHAECELSTFLSGSGVYTVNNKTYQFNAGDVFVFSGNEPHCITEVYEEFVLINTHFMPGLLLSDLGDMSLLKIFFARNSNFANKIDPLNPTTKTLHNKICTIAKELSEKKTGYKLEAKHNLLSCFVSLIRDYDYVDDTISYTGYNRNISAIDKAIRYINDNIEKPLSLDEIASIATMIPTYFSTVFKQINGITPWKYITIKRVEKAIELIKTTDMTKLDIAMECGFSSMSNFYKAFSDVTGKSPREL